MHFDELVPEIRKYHRCSTWHYFKVEEEEKDEIGLMKSVYKNSGYEITNKLDTLFAYIFFKNKNNKD